MIRSMSKSKNIFTLHFQTVAMVWQYTTLLDTDCAETSLQKKDSDTRWHTLGPEASARLDWAFDFALVGNTLEISDSPHIYLKQQFHIQHSPLRTRSTPLPFCNAYNLDEPVATEADMCFFPALYPCWALQEFYLLMRRSTTKL